VYDNKAQKIRYIQFFYTADSGYRDDVATALTRALQSTESGWTVVLMSHAYWTINNGEIIVSQGATNYANLITGLIDDIDADFPLWICGHIHTDMTTTISSSGGKTVRIISTTTDSTAQNPSSPAMTPGTTTEQAFDVYQIDTTNKTINIVRVGAGNSRSYTYS
jgi:hypothetical protein